MATTSSTSSYQFFFTVRFDECDPAGISYFANTFRHHHHAYEGWVVEKLGIPYADWFLNRERAVPIRKTESEYMAPLFPGKTYTVDLKLEEVGSSSFSLSSKISGPTGPCASLKSVHVFMDPKTGRKIDIPPAFKALMESST